MATENIRLTESEVIVKTHEAYYLAVKAKEMGEVTRAYKTLLDELKKNVEGAFRHGMSTRNDIMKVQVKQNEAELAIQKADNNYQLALMNLCHIIGLPLTSEVGVGQPETPTQTSLPAEKGMRPEQVILDNKTELARQNVKLTKSDYLPNVAVGATYFYANGGELAGKKLVDNGSASVGVVVKMPLDLFGGSTNKIRSAKAAYQIAQMEQQDIDEQLELEWAQCRNLYDEAQTEYRLSQVSLDQPSLARPSCREHAPLQAAVRGGLRNPCRLSRNPSPVAAMQCCLGQRSLSIATDICPSVKGFWNTEMRDLSITNQFNI